MNNYTIEIQDKDNQREQYNIKFVNEYEEKFSDNVWFTRKARIQSEKRLRRNHIHSQLLLIEYTLLASILSVVTLRYNKILGEDTDILIAVFSIIILVISLVITNLDFNERANSFKINYIQLQEIYLESKELEKDNKSLVDVRKLYSKALESIENHELIDDIWARVENSSGLKSRKPTKLEYSYYYGYRFCAFVVLLILYILPVITISIMFCTK